MPARIPDLPATLRVPLGVHAHAPGPRLHDDHVCDYVACGLCGKPGKALLGVWLDIVD